MDLEALRGTNRCTAGLRSGRREELDVRHRKNSSDLEGGGTGSGTHWAS